VWHKLLFGSDYPFTTVTASLAGMRKLNDMLQGTALPRLNMDEMEKMFHRDTLKLLGIEATQPARLPVSATPGAHEVPTTVRRAACATSPVASSTNNSNVRDRRNAGRNISNRPRQVAGKVGDGSIGGTSHQR